MSVKEYIEKVKAKPEDEKRRTVFMWTIIIVIVIALVWAMSFAISVANDQADQAQIQAEAEAAAKAQLIKDSTTTPIQTGNSWSAELGQLVSNGASAVSEGFWTVGSWLHPSPSSPPDLKWARGVAGAVLIF